LGGWRAGQILTVALGLLFGVVMVRQLPNAGGIAVAVLLLLVCAGLATWPISGRTSEQWAPIMVRWAVRRSPWRTRHQNDVLGGLRLLQGEWQGMGMVHDVRGRTLTAALSLRGQSFALLGLDEQDRRVAGWSAALAAVAREGSPVRRLQWLAASFPDEGHGVRSYLSRQTSADPASSCVASYESLLSEMDADACTHHVVLAVQVKMTKSVESSGDLLRREVSSLCRLLADADVVVEQVMSADDVAALLTRSYEPHVGPTGGSGPVADPWPMAMAEGWASVRVDAMVHATFWVAEWPRTEVRADFLAPVLLGSSRATLSITMEPLGPDQAVRKVEASRTADLADAELRRRSGFMATARHARQSEVLARREAELADGHASFRYAGFVTVSAPNEDELVVACDAVQHAAGQCRLVLRRLYGDQASAYTCTLPLARGLS
jgi:hypothetical protein